VSGVEIRFVPAAGEEAEDALDWYLQRSLKAAESFLREFERGLELISESPRRWPRFEAGTRRYVLPRFPYSIVYRELRHGIEVVAVAHQKRRPGYWHGR
jgi:plasmid stabilization system protein ParE